MEPSPRKPKISLIFIGSFISAAVGLLFLLGAAASFYKSNDPVLVRDGDGADFFNHLTIILVPPGLLFIAGAVVLLIVALYRLFAKS